MTNEKAEKILDHVKRGESWDIMQLCKDDEKAVYFVICQLCKKAEMIERAKQHLTD